MKDDWNKDFGESDSDSLENDIIDNYPVERIYRTCRVIINRKG